MLTTLTSEHYLCVYFPRDKVSREETDFVAELMFIYYFVQRLSLKQTFVCMYMGKNYNEFKYESHIEVVSL